MARHGLLGRAVRNARRSPVAVMSWLVSPGRSEPQMFVAPGGSCPADDATPPCGPVRRTMTRPLVATSVYARAMPRRIGRGGTTPPTEGPPPRRAASPYPQRRGPGVRQEPGCAPLGVLVIHVTQA